MALIPIADDDEPVVAAVRPAGEGMKVAHPSHPRGDCRVKGLVHIVDDDALIRAWASFILSNSGYSTEIYSCGAELFRDCSLKRGCILLDMCMPQMSGHEVQEELARRGSSLPVVAMSGCGDLARVVRAMKLGAVDFLEKPSTEEKLLEAVARALDSPQRPKVRRNGTTAAVAKLNRLTSRERETLQGLFDGLSNKGIARRLGVSSRTIEMHRASMKSELGVANLAETVQFAIEAELVPMLGLARQGARPPGESVRP